MVIGVILAWLLAVMRRSDNPIMRSVSLMYIWFFRGTPVYVQLTFWGALAVLYPQFSIGIPFGPSFVTFDTAAVVTAFWAALIGLALNEAAYLAEIIRSGLNSVEPGQTEAALALGMSNSQILRRVMMPQAMRTIVPPLGNETISMLKTTSLVIAVPFTLDLFYATSALGNRLYQPMPMLVIASIWYLLITSVLMIGQRYLERFYGKGGGPQHTQQRTQQRLHGLRPGAHRRLVKRLSIQALTKDADPFLDVTP
jgi:polar amino acid transport system permease protein